MEHARYSRVNVNHTMPGHFDFARPQGVVGGGDGETPFYSASRRKLIERAGMKGIVFPWKQEYRVWWFITVIGAIVSLFLIPCQVAFQKHPSPFQLNEFTDWLEMGMTALYMIDILVHFNLAYFDNGHIVFTREEIARRYLKRMFWIDFLGIFPFGVVAWMSGLLGTATLGQDTAHVFSLLKLIGLVRLHRLKKFSAYLRYNTRVSLLYFTLIRNFGAVLAVAHIEGCMMYFLARLNSFDQSTWLRSEQITEMTGWDRYVSSLYLSIVTFCTVGYGDYSPSNTLEQVWSSVFMLLNVVVSAWMIGSITLLIVKGDEKTGEYRDTLKTLHKYGHMNCFDKHLLDKLKSQLKLNFHNREISDEQVLKNFPNAVRRKILRKLYLETLMRSKLMQDVRPHFLDVFLASCTVEIFSPGAEIVEKGAILSDLFLLVGGVAEIVPSSYSDPRIDATEPSLDELSESGSSKSRRKSILLFVSQCVKH
eukprot:scaffold10056_cov164-Amphora_coffeaeformis.AAC.3